MKKILTIIMTFLMAFVVGLGISEAQVNPPEFKVIDEAENADWAKTMKLDSKYAFTFVNPSSVEAIGTVESSCGENIFGGTALSNCFVAKNGVGVIYKNVGVTSDGQKVDLKIELTSFKLVTEKVSGIDDGYIGFATSAINIHQTNVADAVYKFTFLEHGTTKPIKIDGFVSFLDIDHSQYISITSDDGNINTWYVVEAKENIDYKDSNDTVGVLHQDKNWAESSTFNSSSCESILKPNTGLWNLNNNIYTFIGRSGNFASNSSGQLEQIDGDLHGRSSITGYAMATFDDTASFTVNFGRCSTWAKNEVFGVGDSLLKIELPKPVKEVSKEKLEIGEEFTYTISQNIPYQKKSNYYKSYILTDTLEEYLLAPNKEDIKITDKNGKDVTDNFDINVVGQTITATAKNTNSADFYGQRYNFIIPTKVIDSIPNSLFDSNGNYTIPNHATAIIEYNDDSDKETQDTNVVNVIVHNDIQIVVVPSTGAFVPLGISLIGALLIIISVVVYFVITKKKQDNN